VSTPTRLAIIGDIGGHLSMLHKQLRCLGVDTTTAELPDDLIVCQVGDLVHKGPDSLGVLTYVDTLMRRNPRQWVQLLGNHDAQHLPGTTQFWNQQTPAEVTSILRSWWEHGQITIAAAFDVEPAGDVLTGTVAGQLLVTHAGLSAPAMRAATGGVTATAAATAAALNTIPPVVWREGEIITGRNDPCAGPLWAIAATEVYPSWMYRPDTVPFHQAHGHTAICNWRRRRMYPAPTAVADAVEHIDGVARVTRTRIGTQSFFATDPDAAATPLAMSAPLTFHLRPATVMAHAPSAHTADQADAALSQRTPGLQVPA